MIRPIPGTEVSPVRGGTLSGPATRLEEWPEHFVGDVQTSDAAELLDLRPHGIRKQCWRRLGRHHARQEGARVIFRVLRNSFEPTSASTVSHSTREA